MQTEAQENTSEYESTGDDGTGRVEPPRQARSRRSYHRILEATSELLADRAFGEITVDEIVERAGYTKGAFYARFESKGALLRHLVARLTEGASESWDTFLDPREWREASLEEIVESFIRRMASVYSRSGHVMGLVEREVWEGGDPGVRAIVDALNARVAAGFVRLLETRRGALPGHVREDIEGACQYWLLSLSAVLRSGFLHPTAGPVGGSPARVAERTVTLMTPYLAG